MFSCKPCKMLAVLLVLPTKAKSMESFCSLSDKCAAFNRGELFRVIYFSVVTCARGSKSIEKVKVTYYKGDLHNIKGIIIFLLLRNNKFSGHLWPLRIARITIFCFAMSIRFLNYDLGNTMNFNTSMYYFPEK